MLINVSNVLKNEEIPLSYLKGKQIILKDLQNKSPQNIRYNKNLDTSKSEGVLPELRGLSLESYKYI